MGRKILGTDNLVVSALASENWSLGLKVVDIDAEEPVRPRHRHLAARLWHPALYREIASGLSGPVQIYYKTTVLFYFCRMDVVLESDENIEACGEVFY
jgi:hypothetical protein